MNANSMQELAVDVWDARRAGKLGHGQARSISRALAIAAAADVRDCEGYDPESDVRVHWLRELVASLRSGPAWRRPQASADVEYAVGFVIGRLEEEAARTAGG